MGLDADSVTYLMSILTNLYSNPEQAVVREICSNAYDAHLEARQTRPIEVTTPNALNQNFKVQDWGTGMSLQTITEVYANYGASTKREDNIQTGQMGLGAKSPLAVCNQFILVSVHGGLKVTATVGRDEDGTGVITIVDTLPTDEPSGTTITIPVKHGNQFLLYAQDVLQFWEPGTVLLNGKEPAFISGKQITPDILMVKGLRSDYFVQGTAAYPTPEFLADIGYRGYGETHGFVVKAPIGSLSFTPSREALMLTPTTKRTMEEAKEKIKTALAVSIQADIEGASSKADALTRKLAWPAPILKLHPNPTYKGEKIPEFFEEPGVIYGIYEADKRNSYGTAFTYKSRLSIEHCLKATFITGHDSLDDSKTFSSYHKEKVRKWASNSGNTSRYFIICKDLPGDGWFVPEAQGTWVDVKATKLDRTGNTTRVKRTEKYDILGDYGFREISDLDKTKPIYYYSASEASQPKNVGTLQSVFPDAQIIKLGINRHDKFKRDWPTAVHLKDAIVAEGAAAVAALTNTDKFAMNAHWNYADVAKDIPLDQIHDPELVRVLRAVLSKDGSAERIARYRKLTALRNFWYFSIPSLTTTTVEDILQKYPLISTGSPLKREHSILYINAAFAASQEKKATAA